MTQGGTPSFRRPGGARGRVPFALACSRLFLEQVRRLQLNVGLRLASLIPKTPESISRRNPFLAY